MMNSNLFSETAKFYEYNAEVSFLDKWLFWLLYRARRKKQQRDDNHFLQTKHEKLI